MSDTVHFYQCQIRSATSTQPPTALIILYQYYNNKLEEKYSLSFLDDSLPSLPPIHQAENGSFTLHYYMRQYPYIVDLLRNESPIYVTVDKNAIGDFTGHVGTSYPEPAGEGEV